MKNVKTKIKQFSNYLGEKEWFGGNEVGTYSLNVFILLCNNQDIFNSNNNYTRY